MQKIQTIIDTALEKHNNLLKPTLDQVFDEVISNPALCRELFGDVLKGYLEKEIRQRYSQQRGATINAPDSAICGDPGDLDDCPEPPPANEPLPVAATSGVAPPAPRAPSQPSKAYLNGLGIAYQKSLLDFPLSDGKKLRAAVKFDIEKQYGIYRGQSSKTVQMTIFFRRILNALPDDTRPVGAVLDDFALKNHLHLAQKEFEARFPKSDRLESPHANG